MTIDPFIKGNACTTSSSAFVIKPVTGFSTTASGYFITGPISYVINSYKNDISISAGNYITSIVESDPQKYKSSIITKLSDHLFEMIYGMKVD